MLCRAPRDVASFVEGAPVAGRLPAERDSGFPHASWSDDDRPVAARGLRPWRSDPVSRTKRISEDAPYETPYGLSGSI